MGGKKILFVIGSPNQTTQLHKISAELAEYDCFFSQLFTDHPIIDTMADIGLLDSTILGGEFKRKADIYLRDHQLPNDYGGKVFNNRYDLVVMCTDMLVPRAFSKIKTVFVQEGMTDPITPWARFIRNVGLPRYMAMNTAYNGCGNICDIYCVASDGYKQQFSRLGTDPARIMVTGIPNYDNIGSFLKNDFPYHNYVLVATSDARETFRRDDREKFIKHCVAIARERPIIFKLHPNENKQRAAAEIKKYAPAGALIFTEGNTEHMIANCDELITQYSTVVYIGIALGKKVHSYFDFEKLRQLSPVQNGGRSASSIADICRSFLEFDGNARDFLKFYSIRINQKCA